MSQVRTVVFIGVFFLSVSLHAQTVLEVEKSDFNESYVDNVDVSGSVLASFLVSGNAANASPNELYIFVPQAIPSVFLTLASIDGKYSADATVALPSDAKGWIQLQLPSDYDEKIRTYGSQELVAFAFIDAKDMFGNYIQEVFPTSWGKPNYSSQHFFINSAGFAPNVLFKNSDGQLITVDCDAIDAKFTRVFNFVCDIGSYEFTGKSVFTFSPDYESSGKNYLVWTANERRKSR